MRSCSCIQRGSWLQPQLCVSTCRAASKQRRSAGQTGQEAKQESPPRSLCGNSGLVKRPKDLRPGVCFPQSIADKHAKPEAPFALEILSTPSVSLFSRLRARLKFSLSSGAQRRRRTPLTDELQRSAPSVRARSLLSLSRYLRRLFNPFFHPSSRSADSRDDPGLMAARRSEVATEPRLVVLSDVGLGLCGKTGGRG